MKGGPIAFAASVTTVTKEAGQLALDDSVGLEEISLQVEHCLSTYRQWVQRH